jgi:hypothetical protein
MSKLDLKVPVLGDIRLLRNDIVHHNAVATPRIAKCEVLKWFAPGDHIQLNAERVDSAVLAIRAAIGDLHSPATA